MESSTYPPRPEWLTDKQIEAFRKCLKECPNPYTDEDMKNWKDTTFKRLRSGYFQFMTDANLLRKEKTRYLITPPVLDIALERYLQYNGMEQILKAITGVR